MKQNKFFYFLGLSVMILGLLPMTGCDDDDDDNPPTVALSATTFTGKTGETATTTATVTAPDGFKEMRVTKYLGTSIDPSFGTNGTQTVSNSSYTLNYELTEEGVSTPVRFNFQAEDDKGNVGDADFIITTELSVEYLLLNFDWQWDSKLGKCLAEEDETEMIFECEEDNVYSFNADGTMSLDYGTITGTGGGTCDFDGFSTYTNWDLSADESTLTLTYVNAFDPLDITEEVYMIQEFNVNRIEATQTVDLTVFGCIIYDWTFGFTAVPK